MGLVILPMFGKWFLEEFVGKNAGLWEAVHAFADFHVDVSIKMLYDVCW